ncbi:MAG: flippase [Patescibacteria group bacterium]|nr:flippase [Patescibacteria group bacterium]
MINREVGKITTNTAAQLLGKAFSAGTTVITTAIIARRFGAAEFGAFFLMTGFATYFYLLTDFGINAIATRDLSADFSKAQKYFNNLLTLRLLEALVIFLVLFFLVPLIPFRLADPNVIRFGILIGLLTIFSQSVYNCATIIFQTTLSYEKLVVSSIIGNLTFLALVLWLVEKGFGLLPLVAANTFGAIIVAAVSLYLAGQVTGQVSLDFDFAFWKKIITTSLPLGAGIVLTVVVAKSDQFLLSVLRLSPSLEMTNDVALGNYGLAYKVFENILVFPTYFVNAVYPLMVKNYAVDAPKFRRIFWSSLVFMVGASIAVGALGIYFSPLIIEIIGGRGFVLAPTALRVLLFGLPFFFSSALFLFLMITQNQQKIIPFIYLIAAVFNFCSNYLLIPKFGFMASAWLTGATELLILVLVAYFGLKGFRSSES